ncbi:MAG TPA: DUF1707 domain-containing protein [Streptosporangiaceae bacterium]|nr:DUF1707 domain-containing protein [Streptosporangiaceae bacterium]
MPGDPRIRASDADRDRVATLLREHHAAGRLDADEVQERIDKALTARTLGDLDALTADLPHIDLHRLPHESMARGGQLQPRPRSPLESADARAAVAGAAAIAAIIAAYVVAGVVFGIWWIPWWLVVVIPVILIRRMRQRP